MSNWFHADRKLPLLVLSLFLLTFFASVGLGQEGAGELTGLKLPDNYIIGDVPYVPMYSYWSTCAMSSLEMALAYYGYDYSIMTLMNLGWQYGATLVENESGPVLMPGAEQPTDGILHAAKTLGFSVNEKNNQTKEKAWKTLKKYIANDTPVVIQWTMHTVLAVGYDESGNEGEIVYHNPAPPARLLESYTGLTKGDLGPDLGKFSRMDKNKWFGSDYWVNANSYPTKKYEMITLDPPKERKEIDWEDIMERNSKKTLGAGDWSSYPPYVWYSVDAFRKAAESIESGEWSKKELTALFSASDWGPASRSHAAAFLSGLAQSYGIEELEEAGRQFERSGYYWQEANDTWNYVKENPDLVEGSRYRKVISDALKKVALAEEKAGKELGKAGKKF